MILSSRTEGSAPAPTPVPRPTRVKPKTREDVVFRRLGDEFAILDPEANQVHILNASSAAVWVLCDGHHDLAGIATEVSEAFGVEGETSVRADVEEAVASFRERGLLQ